MIHNKIKITQSGRGGSIIYQESVQQLSFSWEFAIDGVLIFFPSTRNWDNFCDGSDFLQTQGRREEILKKVCEEVIHQKASGSQYLIKEDCISITFRSGK